MKVLVTGVTGQLGFDVIRELLEQGYDAVGTSIEKEFHSVITDEKIEATDYYSLDITNEKKVKSTVTEINPDVIIHCSAWTAVDAAEDNVEKVMNINVNGTKYLAESAKEINAKFVYISTDYVFDGTGNEPWSPDSKDYGPDSVYGESKLEGEKVVSSILEKYFIVRIAWVYGINGSNFVKTMLDIGKKHSQVSVVSDQIGTPTYTYDLSRLLVEMIKSDKYGYYHATNEGNYISWYEFTKEIYRQAGLNTQVTPVTTEEYGKTKAVRPLNSRLDRTKLIENGFEPLPNWDDALSHYLSELNRINNVTR